MSRINIQLYFSFYSADEDIDSKFPTNIVVYNTGLCSWIPLGIYISSCSINIKWFPFDDQYCKLKFGSWTYDGSKINLTSKQATIGGFKRFILFVYEFINRENKICKILSA